MPFPTCFYETSTIVFNYLAVETLGVPMRAFKNDVSVSTDARDRLPTFETFLSIEFSKTDGAYRLVFFQCESLTRQTVSTFITGKAFLVIGFHFVRDASFFDGFEAFCAFDRK